MNLGERYKELRLSIKNDLGQPISIKDFSEKYVELSPPRISELENNKREMSLTELKAYHKCFNVSFEYLLGETDTSTTNEDVQIACKVTELTEETIKKIKEKISINEYLESNDTPWHEMMLEHRKRINYVVNTILSSCHFWGIALDLCTIITNSEQLKDNVSNILDIYYAYEMGIKDENDEQIKNVNSMCNAIDKIDVSRYRASQKLENICDIFDSRKKMEREENGKHNTQKE